MTYRNDESIKQQSKVPSRLRKWLGRQCRQTAALLDPGTIPGHSEPSCERLKPREEQGIALSRKLIEAQDQERSRIARELHDDINQQLAMLAVDVNVFQQNLPSVASEIRDRLIQVQERIIEVSMAVQLISYRLHSHHVEHLGILASMQGFCRDFAARQHVEIEFSHDEIPRNVSNEISSSLFRVMQEALSNAAKHSNSTRFAVKLSCSASQLHLTISDHGSGFDVKTAMNNGGLGLTSMCERARIMNGTIAIESKPRIGTMIALSVPLASLEASQQTVG